MTKPYISRESSYENGPLFSSKRYSAPHDSNAETSTPEEHDDALVRTRFRLQELYKTLEDPSILRDVEAAISLASSFQSSFQGKLNQKLGAALTALAEIHTQISRPMLYLHLSLSCDSANEKARQVASIVRERWAVANANHLTFFEQEVGHDMSEERYQALLQSDDIVLHHRGYVDHVRKLAAHRLGSDVERALTLRSPFGPEEWRDYFDETEVSLRFRVQHPDAPRTQLALSETLNLCYHHQNGDLRFAALKSLNRGLKKSLASISTRTLNAVLGSHGLETKERDFPHSMASRNLENMISDSVVDALHHAVRSEGANQAKRYYRLLAKQLKQKTLRWSDRTAKCDSSTTKIAWEDGIEIVRAAWSKFSPTLASFATKFVDEGWVDAPPYRGKQSGAFNYSVILPAPHGIRSYTFMNYHGTERDVMTLAHEFGHGVHGMLAAQAQGPLLHQAPLAYAETASIFGEMLVFEHLRAQEPAREFSLLMDKCSDVINTVVRQISFSFFEQRAHALRNQSKLTAADFTKLWHDVTVELYGPEGELFTYAETDYLWTYVSHFMSPFYVYAYAFGELLTQSLFALRTELGDRFEPLYLDLLRAGGSKDAVALLKPFGLNPNDPDFWMRGIRCSLGAWLDRAEELSRDTP